jgi:hypothetical protein
MAKAESKPAVAEPTAEEAAPIEAVAQQSLVSRIIISIATTSWLASMVIHMAIFIVLALVLGTVHVAQTIGSAPLFESVDAVEAQPEIEHFEVGDTPLDPTELTTESLTLTEAPTETVDAQFNSDSPIFEEAGGGVAGESQFGGLAGFNVAATGLGPVVRGAGGVDGGGGFGKNFGKGGAGSGFGSRGSGMREAMIGNGGTKQSERAVAAALNWIARHQNPNGSWSINHAPNCKGGFCSASGDAKSDPAATAMALLPFFAAGQTHESKGPYQRNIGAGINWLIKNQGRNGDLSVGGASQMYTHGLCAIAMCEAYGMTQDSRIGISAQMALDFIMSGQNNQGSWRYSHGSDDSDTSVFGWQVMALKSGQMAGLKVQPASIEGCKKYLKLCSSGKYKSEFGYTPGGGPTYTMTSVGLLTSQYLGAGRSDPAIVGGVEYLSKHKPTLQTRNSYYWYYATQVMHNVPGTEWDEWNRAMRRILIQTQDKTGCAAGSWDPDKPTEDPWGRQGGRLMVTSLSCLTLEVYYRYLPLYKVDNKEADLNKVN